jgi:hypothetical protein
MFREPSQQPHSARGRVSRRRVLATAAFSGAGLVGLTLIGGGPTRIEAQAEFHNSPSDRLRIAMRKLWEDHITWTRLFIVSAIAGLPDLEPTAQRLLQNQTDIGNAIMPFYGDAAGDQLTSLLREHILIAADLVNAAKSGDAAKVADAKGRWYANADAIAAFLNQANPEHWSLDDMQGMMHDHLDLTLAEAVARLQNDWPADIAAYDRVHTQILLMADMLAAGIIDQFPEQFL